MKWWTWLLLVPLTVVSFFYVHDLLSGVYPPYSSSGSPHPRYPQLGIPWPMHPPDNPGDWLPNGLKAADVNGDGWLDIVANVEEFNRLSAILAVVWFENPGR